MTSLNGEVEQGVIVEAVGDRPECAQEESKTEADGSYRIRGLQVSYHRCCLGTCVYMCQYTGRVCVVGKFM